jgi:plastocyanin
MKAVVLHYVMYTFACLMLLLPTTGRSQTAVDHSAHSGHKMSVEPSGVVMNENHTTLPRDCKEISRDYAITIHAGRRYASDIPGAIFGMSEHEVRVQPCSRIELTFVNDDEVRHQWMVHGLPKYLYPAGMFHIEVSGGYRKTGTFIVPGDDRTYLIHCDMAQHMEKGMRGQLVVGAGSGNLWGVAGISDQFYRSGYLPHHTLLLALLVMIFSFVLTIRLVKKR